MRLFSYIVKWANLFTNVGKFAKSNMLVIDNDRILLVSISVDRQW